MEIDKMIEVLPKGITTKAKNTDIVYINTLSSKIGVLQEYIDEEIFANINVIIESGSTNIRKFADAVAFNILRLNKLSTPKAWSTLFGTVGAESNSYSYSRQRMVVSVADSMDESVKTRFSGIKYKAVERMIDLMDGKAQPSVIPLFNTIDGVQEPMYHEDGSRAYKEVYMTVTPKIQLEASCKLIDVLEREVIVVDDNVKNEYELLAGKLESIAERQRQDLIDGASITDVQVIGDLLSMKDDDEA